MGNGLSPRRVGKIGSSMVAGLFGQSPYITRLGLYAHFVNGYDIDSKPDKRMGWGKRLQSAILEATAEANGLAVIENEGDDWHDHPDPALKCGATVDARCFDPSRGEGLVEAKNLDYLRWRDTWTEAKAPPHVELQAQHQLLVTGAAWCDIAALVGGNDLKLYRREPIPAIQERIVREIESFWRQVRDKTPPDPMGVAAEIPELAALYPEVQPVPILEIFDGLPAADFVEAIRERLAGEENVKIWQDIKDAATAKLLAIMGNHGLARAPGYRVKLLKPQTKASIVELPRELRRQLMDAVNAVRQTTPPHPAIVALVEAAEAVSGWFEVTRKAGIQQRFTIEPVAGDPPAPDRIMLSASAKADAQFGG